MQSAFRRQQNHKMKNRVKSNIIVTVPDLSGPIKQALKTENASRTEKGHKLASGLVFSEFGFVQTKAGMFSLTTEGVGDSEPITDSNPLIVDFSTEFTEEDGRKSWCMFPAGSIHLRDTELLMLPALKEVPLEEFIRSFGRRLETNYNIWLKHLTKAQPMVLEHNP